MLVPRLIWAGATILYMGAFFAVSILCKKTRMNSGLEALAILVHK